MAITVENHKYRIGCHVSHTFDRYDNRGESCVLLFYNISLPAYTNAVVHFYFRRIIIYKQNKEKLERLLLV